MKLEYDKSSGAFFLRKGGLNYVLTMALVNISGGKRLIYEEKAVQLSEVDAATFIHNFSHHTSNIDDKAIKIKNAEWEKKEKELNDRIFQLASKLSKAQNAKNKAVKELQHTKRVNVNSMSKIKELTSLIPKELSEPIIHPEQYKDEDIEVRWKNTDDKHELVLTAIQAKDNNMWTLHDVIMEKVEQLHLNDEANKRS